GPSDIEGKTTRVGASECGQRTSFNRTRVAGHQDQIQGVLASALYCRSELPALLLACDLALSRCIEQGVPDTVVVFHAVRFSSPKAALSCELMFAACSMQVAVRSGQKGKEHYF